MALLGRAHYKKCGATSSDVSLQGKNHRLEITEFCESDRGRYTAVCVGMNVETSAIIELALPPLLKTEKDSITLVAGAPAVLSASYKGFPKPSISWYKV